MPLMPALRRQRQADLCKVETSLNFRLVPGQPGLHTKKPCLGKTKQNKKPIHSSYPHYTWGN